MTKEINSFWNLSPSQFNRKIETQIEFYEMLKTADRGVRSFVYWPSELVPKTREEFKIYNISFTNCSFAFTEIKNLSFYNCRFENCKFNHCRFENCQFHDCSFRYVNMFKTQILNTYINPGSFRNIIPNIKDFIGAVNNANMCVSFFQTLINNSKDAGQTEFQKKAHYHFKKWKGLNYLQKRFTKQPYSERLSWKYFLLRFPSNLFQYLFIGYGYRVTNFLLTFFLGFLFFFYFNSKNWANYDLEKKDVSISVFNANSANLSSNFYYTLDATTKLVDSQIQPTSNSGMIWLSAQGVFGFILLSGLISIILNKFVK